MRLGLILAQGLLQASVIFADTFAITGAQSGISPSGARPFRQDINTFQNSGPAWDLYIIAMQRFMQIDQGLFNSYFRVAGIHGYPNLPWDGVSGTQDDAGGFCVHNSVLFPTWHRPYMALFEQVIWNISQSVAQQYPEPIKDAYVQAAITLRIPYWDWSLNATIPSVASVVKISINTPEGLQEIDNPLWTYDLGNITQNETFFPTWGTATSSTVRHPDSSGNTNTTAANAAMQQVASSLFTGIYHLLSQPLLYNQFSNAAWRPQNIGLAGHTGLLSIESLHNIIHRQVGGRGGQMSDIPTAAFDPLFWLHHANVDRIFAIWEALNPTEFIAPYPASEDSWITPEGTIQDEAYPLYPFHNDSNGGLFASSDVRGTAIFGYAYPEVVDWNKTSAELTSDVTMIVNEIYNPSDSSKRSRLAKNTIPLSETNKANYQWIVNMDADLSQLDQSVSIYFYVTSPPNSSASWATDPNVIATQPFIINSRNSMSNRTMTAHSYLTYALLHLVGDLSPESVIPLIKSNLQWRAIYANGSVIHPKAINTTGAICISVASQRVEQNNNTAEFPVYYDWTVHGSATLGQNNGFVL